MTDRKMERKTFPAFVTKADEEQGIIEAVFAVFGNVDQGDDVVHPGAFTKTFTERGHKVKVLDNHRTDSIMRVIGKPLELREIGRDQLPPQILEKVPEATGGAFAKIQMLMDTPEGKGAFIRLRDSAVDEWSFGYDTLDYDYSKEDEERTRRNLRTVKLYEISPVLWAMNQATTTTAAKASESKPWNVFPVGSEFCVFRVDDEGDRMGESLGCHDTRAAARQQVEVLYANEQAGDEDISDEEKKPMRSEQDGMDVPSKVDLISELANAIIEQVEKERQRFAETLYHVATFDYEQVYNEYAKQLGKSELDEKDKKQAILNAVLNEQARPSLDETPTSKEDGPQDKGTPTDELLKLIEIGQSEISIMEV